MSGSGSCFFSKTAYAGSIVGGSDDDRVRDSGCGGPAVLNVCIGGVGGRGFRGAAEALVFLCRSGNRFVNSLSCMQITCTCTMYITGRIVNMLAKSILAFLQSCIYMCVRHVHDYTMECV